MIALPPPGTILGGRYRLDSLRGQGGMGAVYAATNLATGRAVAIKWLLPDASRSAENIARFLNEARAAGAIEHPNVIGIIDVGQEQGAPFLVMELLRGEPLSSRITRGRVPWPEALDVLIPTCLGVAQAHAEGIVHRDLKPANVFLVYDKAAQLVGPKVLDFGVAKFYEEATPALTETGVSMGTPNYMCPQQIEDPRAIEPSWDVYAMGVVLYETLAGRRPYDAVGLSDLVREICGGRPTPLRALAPEVPAELEVVVMRAMAADARARHRNMVELAMDLARFRPHALPAHVPAHGAPALATPAPAAAPRPPGPRRAFWLVGCAAVAGLSVAGAVAAAIVIVRGWPRDAEPAPGVQAEPTKIAEPSDPSAPRVELTFEGCAPDFDGSIRVSTVQDSIHVDSYEAGVPRAGIYVLPNGTAMEGPVHLPDGIPRIGPRPYVVLDTNDGRRWRSRPSDPQAGFLVARQWDAERGAIDLTLNAVRLEESTTRAPCLVDGRVTTFGRTDRGSPPPARSELTFNGCSAQFASPLAVEPFLDQMAFGRGAARMTVHTAGARMDGIVALAESGQWLVMVHMVVGREFYSSNPPEPGAGWLEVAAWDGGAASMDIVLHDVALRHAQTRARCTINGRIRTFGRREASP